MKFCSKTALTVHIGVFILASSFLFTTTECKTVSSSRVPQSSSRVSSTDSSSSNNVFYSVARSLATEALTQFKETARRNPRLGFNITMLLPAAFANMTGKNGTGNPFPVGNLIDTTSQLGIIGLKGGILGIKAVIVQAIVLVLFVVFLLAGIAYFACNIGIISCANVGGSLANFGGGLGGAPLGQLTGGANPFSRTGYDYHQNLQRSTSAIYNAIDDGQKKYT